MQPFLKSNFWILMSEDTGYIYIYNMYISINTCSFMSDMQ